MAKNTHTHNHADSEHKDHKHTYKHIKVTKLPGSEAEITGEIIADELERCRAEAIKSLSERVEIPGFRKGNASEQVLVSKLGEMAILEEAASIAISNEYVHIIIDEKLEVIGRPEITFTKIARGNPLEFKIKVALFPEVKIPDYKKIAKAEMKEDEKIEVTEKEMEEAIEQVRKYHAAHEGHDHSHEGHDHDHDHGEHDHAHDEKVETDDKDKKGGKKEKPLPEFNDEFVQKMGDFKNVDEFKTKLKENLMKEKEHRGKEKKRLKISDELIAGAKVDLPEILVSSELKKMWGEFEADISRMGLKAEDYLKHIKKTRAELETGWRKDAEKRVTLQIIINKIATEEKIMVPEADLQKEMAMILESYKGADPERVRNYVEMVMTNERVYQFLEAQK